MDEAQLLLIERACERLVTTYCHLVDHGQAAEIAALFTDDGAWTSSETAMTGRLEIMRGFQRRQNNHLRRSRHICSNLLIDVLDADNARGVAYVTLYRHDGPAGRKTSPLGAPELVGEYRDTFARTTEGWRFRRREVSVDFLREDKAKEPAT